MSLIGAPFPIRCALVRSTRMDDPIRRDDHRPAHPLGNRRSVGRGRRYRFPFFTVVLRTTSCCKGGQGKEGGIRRKGWYGRGGHVGRGCGWGEGEGFVADGVSKAGLRDDEVSFKIRPLGYA